MNQTPKDIKRWTARGKAAAIMEIINVKSAAADFAIEMGGAACLLLDRVVSRVLALE
jgi:hypothetical protein